jgi:hypothetical protein
VEAPARALGEVRAVDEDDVEPAQRGVPRDTRAGRTATDYEDLCADRGHGESTSSQIAPALILPG